MTIVIGILIAWAILTGLYVAVSWAPERSVEELRARWAPAPSVFLNVAGMKVHLRDEGPRDDASPIVLMHGTLSSLHSWDGWVEALTGKRRVVRFDLPGFGLTGPSPDRFYSTDNDVRLVIAILDSLSIERCVLGGNSAGGGIAWQTALAHPARVEKLILVDANGYATRPTSMPIAFYFARMPMIDWMVRNTFPPGLVAQGLRNVFGDASKVTRELMVRTRELTLREGNRRALIARGRQWLAAIHRLPPHCGAEIADPHHLGWPGRLDSTRYRRAIPPRHRRQHDGDLR